jgi:DNA-3-methyladenine glycosylase II
MLGTDCELSNFNKSVWRDPWLAQLGQRMRGLRPPRYPELFEACANAIVFQQVSLPAPSCGG